MQFDKHDPFKIGSYERLTLEAFYISFRNPLRMPRYIDKTDQLSSLKIVNFQLVYF